MTYTATLDLLLDLDAFHIPILLLQKIELLHYKNFFQYVNGELPPCVSDGVCNMELLCINVKIC